MERILEREVKSDTQSLAELTGSMQEFMRAAGVPARVANDVLVAFDEICSNIMIHGYKNDPRGSIRVVARLNRRKIEITFTDHGAEYEPRKEDPRLGKALLTEEYPGLGLFITKKLMDEFHYEHANGENRTRLVKKIP